MTLKRPSARPPEGSLTEVLRTRYERRVCLSMTCTGRRLSLAHGNSGCSVRDLAALSLLARADEVIE